MCHLAGAALARPRPPLPPWPERGFLVSVRFDSTNQLTDAKTGLLFQDVALAESWSGYALSMEGPAPKRFVIPAVDGTGKANLACTAGTIRFWFKPSWSSMSMGGSGPGTPACLLEVGAWAENQSVGWWSLQFSPVGDAISLVAGSQGECLEMLRVAIGWQAGEWHQVALSYSPQGSWLFLDGQLAAEGPAVALVPLDGFRGVFGVAVGSDAQGSNLAQGQFDEVTTFKVAEDAVDVAWNYSCLAAFAVLGPITPEEDAARLARLAALQGTGAGGGQMMMSLSGPLVPPGGGGGTNETPMTNSWVWASGFDHGTNLCFRSIGHVWTNQTTNVYLSLTNNASTNSHDLYVSTNLSPVSLWGGATQGIAWNFLANLSAGCTNLILSNVTATASFYVVAVHQDADGDGLRDGHELFLYKTDPNNADTDDDGMPDGWELAHGLNPLDPADADEDPDDDGVRNANEYRAGTDPFDSMAMGWGDNLHGQSLPPWGLGAVTAVATGGALAAGGHTLGLTPEGTVLAWGGNLYGQTNTPTNLSNVAAIAAGGDQSAALMSNGMVTTWGRLRTTDHCFTNARAISIGYYHLLALGTDGRVLSWATNDCPVNTVPSGLAEVRAISAGWNHNLALRSNGMVVAWGLGSDAFGWNLTNVPANLNDVAAIAAGALHSVALRSNGTVVAWGSNASGETNVPPSLSNVVSIAAGRGYTLAQRADGTIEGWGTNLPPWPGGLDQARLSRLAPGQAHIMAVRRGVLLPIFVRPPAPSAVPVGSKATFSVEVSSRREPAYQWQYDQAQGTWLDIAGATNATLEITNIQGANEGRYRVWAGNGAGAAVSPSAPLVVVTPPVITSPLAAQTLRVGPKAELTLTVTATNQGSEYSASSYRWYRGGQPLLRTPGASTLVLGGMEPLETGQYWVVVTNLAGGATSAVWTVQVASPGFAAGWGRDDSGQAWPSASRSNVIALAAGGSHSLCLDENGFVSAWGANGQGQTNVPLGLSNVLAVAAGGVIKGG
jgi:hypothetical protein